MVGKMLCVAVCQHEDLVFAGRSAEKSLDAFKRTVDSLEATVRDHKVVNQVAQATAATCTGRVQELTEQAEGLQFQVCAVCCVDSVYCWGGC